MKNFVGFLALALLCFSPLAFAQSPADQTKQASSSAPSEQAETPATNYYYEKMTLENLSRTYWALSKFDPKDDKAIDFFAMLNECDLYKQFSGNEFEWASIREATRKSIEINKKLYPLRYEMMQPIRFGEYDKESQAFEILDEDKIEGVRRFEVSAENFADSVCGYDPSGYGKNIPGYPRGLIIELSRPIGLVKVPLETDLAQRYLEEKTGGRDMDVNAVKSKDQIYALRTAYMVMKIKIFSYKQDVAVRGSPNLFAEVMAILEKIEIYSDRERKNLLYSEDYTRKKKNEKKVNLLKKAIENSGRRVGLLAPDVPNLMPVEDAVPSAADKKPTATTPPPTP